MDMSFCFSASGIPPNPPPPPPPPELFRAPILKKSAISFCVLGFGAADFLGGGASVLDDADLDDLEAGLSLKNFSNPFGGLHQACTDSRISETAGVFCSRPNSLNSRLLRLKNVD